MICCNFTAGIQFDVSSHHSIVCRVRVGGIEASFVQAAGFIGGIRSEELRRKCETRVFCNLGIGYADIFEKAKCVECFNHAIKVAQEIGDEVAERRAHVAKGEAYTLFSLPADGD